MEKTAPCSAPATACLSTASGWSLCSSCGKWHQSRLFNQTTTDKAYRELVAYNRDNISWMTCSCPSCGDEDIPRSVLHQHAAGCELLRRDVESPPGSPA